jgi:soluble lytic murein transglycosylase
MRHALPLLISSVALAAAPEVRAEAELTLVVAAPFADARADLAEGHFAAARTRLGEKDGAPPPLVSAPGLYGAALEGDGDHEAACDLYLDDAREHPERAEAAWLRRARCLERAGDGGAVWAWRRVLDGEVLGREELVADEAVSRLVAAGDTERVVRALASAGADGLLGRKPNPKDTLRREAHARVLLVMAKHGAEHGENKLASAALTDLYLHFGETPAGRDALKLPAARALRAHEDLNLALGRAEALTARHDNAAVFATLSPHSPKPADVSEPACLVRLYQGKAARKLRRYKTARAALDVAATRCSGDTKRRARYLQAHVAYWQGSSQAKDMLGAFAKDYPEGGLTDDVLFWRAELLERGGDLDDAEKVYRQIADGFSDGDMREDARFNLAFLRARRGDASGARAVLDEIARTTKSSAVIERDRALYWRARLQLYPQLGSYSLTSDKAQRDAGYDELLAFATSRPASYYGHLARLLSAHTANQLGRDPAEVSAHLKKHAGAGRRVLDGGRSISVGPRLSKDAAFGLAAQLAAAGYDPEARMLLDGIDFGALEEAGRLALTLLYAQVGADDRSHQVMRFTGHALPHGKPTKETMLTWHLTFPRAHDKALTAGAAAVKGVPGTMLMGLAREESAFDADVISWAGAIGLCQLMPFTAKEEAGLLKLGDPALSELRTPQLNARLGANHLSRRMYLGHPLLAIAAYNAGPGNVAKWRKADDFTTLDAWVESIPVEQTRNYVKKVTGSWVVYEALDGDVESVRFKLELP